MTSDSSMHATHHASLYELVDHTKATHVAVVSGSWSDPSIWRDGVIPDDDGHVVIGEGVHVRYDSVSDVRLHTVRVDGTLSFATDTSTKMVLDTMVVTEPGHLVIGTEDEPVRSDVSVDIIIANNGAIDVIWDPDLLSRGIVAEGAVSIHGAEKTAHGKVTIDPMVGDTFVEMTEAPEGWAEGDTIVIAGTHYDGYKWDNDIRAVRHYESEDEVRTISLIDGQKVFFEDPLVYDHDAPRADLKTSVANYSRNVSFSTEGGNTAAVHERGHTMFMNGSETDIRYAAFYELGRTDKSQTALEASDFDTVKFDSNVKGRYAFHLHQTGIDDVENPSIAVGNVVFGSPGWGYVHHSSNSIMHENASFNTFGAGFVAEAGDEIGSWTKNIAIYAKGVSWAAVKNEVDIDNFDTGKTGDGFWFQGRMVEASGNIAASVNHGYAYFHRGGTGEGRNATFDATSFELPEALGLNREVRPDDAPILHFRDNETFAAKEGLHIVKANPNQGHDVHSVIDGFKGWNVRSGAHFEYTSHYTIRDFDLIGKDATPFSKSEDGISFGPNTSDMTVVRPKIVGFDRSGINLEKKFTDNALSADLHKYIVVDADFAENSADFLNFDPILDYVITSDDLQDKPFQVIYGDNLDYKEGWKDPEGRRVSIEVQKIDSIGATSLPAGTDNYDAGIQEVIRILEEDGYFTAANGQNYFVLEDYYSDRLTGDIEKVGRLVRIDENVPLQSQYQAYKNAKWNGSIDLANEAPVAEDDTAVTAMEEDLILDLLGNDRDPESDTLEIDGILQPYHGQVFDNGDGTVTYRPDFGFVGTDTFKYWATDNFGNFSQAVATIMVKNSEEKASIDSEPSLVVAELGHLEVDHERVEVQLSHEFFNPIVFAQVQTKHGRDAVVTRLDDITSDSFSVWLQEPEGYDGWHKAENVSYLVLEAGNWNLDGVTLSVGTIEINKLGETDYFDVSYGREFDGVPAVVSQVQTVNGSEFIKTRQGDASTSNFRIKLEKDELTKDELHPSETIGWVGISDSSSTNSDAEDFHIDHGKMVDVTNKVSRIDFQNSGTIPHVFAQLTSSHGADPATVRLGGVTEEYARLNIEEDQSFDHEVSHVKETIDWFAFSDSGIIYGEIA